MNLCKLKAENLKFSYGKEKILNGLSLETNFGDVLIIKGPNGSGKSTLIKILSGLLTPNGGNLLYFYREKEVKEDNFFNFFGFCSVDQNLYEELSLYENLEFLYKLKGFKEERKIDEWLERANLLKIKKKLYKNLSSGMKQRAKLISAVVHQPIFLFLDEPSSNLDEEGFNFLKEIIEEQRDRGICFIATNDEREFSFGNKYLELGR